MAILVQKIAVVVAAVVAVHSIGIVAKEATVAAAVALVVAAIAKIDMAIIIDVAKTEATIVNETLNQQHHFMVCSGCFEMLLHPILSRVHFSHLHIIGYSFADESERPKLLLMPRTVTEPINALAETKQAASIFGAAKPREENLPKVKSEESSKDE